MTEMHPTPLPMGPVILRWKDSERVHSLRLELISDLSALSNSLEMLLNAEDMWQVDWLREREQVLRSLENADVTPEIQFAASIANIEHRFGDDELLLNEFYYLMCAESELDRLPPDAEVRDILNKIKEKASEILEIEEQA